jgi:hypothetical protein
LAVVLDFYSRKVLGYAFSDSLESGLVSRQSLWVIIAYRQISFTPLNAVCNMQAPATEHS